MLVNIKKYFFLILYTFFAKHLPISSNPILGKDVMIAPDLFVFASNHNFERVDIPMRLQGSSLSASITIEDNVWIGRGVSILAGKSVLKGSIVAAGCVLTKTFPEFSIIGGNPSRLIRNRK